VWSRYDARWLYPHIPLRFFENKGIEVWTSPEEGNGGVNDRHIVMRRSRMNVVFGVWRFMALGFAAEVFLTELEDPSRKAQLELEGFNAEQLLITTLELHYIPMSHFPVTYYLTCNGTSTVHLNHLPGNTPDGLIECWPEAVAYRVNITCEQVDHAGPLRHIRYIKEFVGAATVAECLSLRGGWKAGLRPCWCDGSDRDISDGPICGADHLFE
jgi:hypothetical protein